MTTAQQARSVLQCAAQLIASYYAFYKYRFYRPNVINLNTNMTRAVANVHLRKSIVSSIAIQRIQMEHKY